MTKGQRYDLHLRRPRLDQPARFARRHAAAAHDNHGPLRYIQHNGVHMCHSLIRFYNPPSFTAIGPAFALLSVAWRFTARQ